MRSVTGKGPAAADQLLAIFKKNYWPGMTTSGQPFAIHWSAPSVMIKLSELREHLSAEYVSATGKVPPSNAMADLMASIGGICAKKERAQPSLRVARRGNEIYLDLGRRDGLAAALSSSGWRLAERYPVLFARSKNMTAELPVPAPPGTGSLDAVRGLFNIPGHAEWALFIACRIASLFPDITHPVEILTGPPGSGKTTVMRLMSNWMDPAPAMLPQPRDGRQWATMAVNRYLAPMDNVSGVTGWLSDLLCKASSGDAWIDRALYQDLDVVVAAIRSVVILNGIELGHIRGDLADRMVRHELTPPAGGYISDHVIGEAWAAAWPPALGWLLDRACEVMADLGGLPAAGGSRLVQFEQIVRCVDARWGTQAMQRWAGSRQDVMDDVLEGDPVAMAMTEAVKSAWSGTSSQLLDLLRLYGLSERRYGGSEWTARALSGAVDRARIALEQRGWQIMRNREGAKGDRVWHIIPPQGGNGQAERAAWRSYPKT